MSAKNSYQKIAQFYSSRWDRGYVASKLRTDPLYSALAAELTGSSLPLLDLGCGLGLLAFFLREQGLEIPISGLDYDERKVHSARQAMAVAMSRNMSFSHHDLRQGVPEHAGNVSILDILQFFTAEAQAELLTLAASRVAPGGKLMIRSGLRDSSLRFKVTVAGDLLAKASFWMKAAPTHYPTAIDFQNILRAHGQVEITPLWGKTPFNNHLIVLRKSQF